MDSKSKTIESTQAKGNASISDFYVKGKITTIKNKNALKRHYIAPESVSLLFDEKEPIIWLVQSDKSGYKMVRAYDLRMHYDKVGKV